MSSRSAVEQARDQVEARLMGDHHHPAVVAVRLANRHGVPVVLVLISVDHRDATEDVLRLAEHEPIEINYLPEGARIVAHGGMTGYGLLFEGQSWDPRT